jgi:hypothetical protein
MFMQAGNHRQFCAEVRTMMCEICGKDKVVQVLRLKLSDEEEPREVKICDECAGKMKTKKR